MCRPGNQTGSEYLWRNWVCHTVTLTPSRQRPLSCQANPRHLTTFLPHINTERLARSLPTRSAFGRPPMSRLPKPLHSSTTLGMTNGVETGVLTYPLRLRKLSPSTAGRLSRQADATACTSVSDSRHRSDQPCYKWCGDYTQQENYYCENGERDLLQEISPRQNFGSCRCLILFDSAQGGL